ncbi:MAG: TlpA family protein disulfide reductase [Deltaproteobacteria bacterium]|nr:TlpA family protein disulfide reductase [Deltaproteobacteria bacterium]
MGWWRRLSGLLLAPGRGFGRLLSGEGSAGGVLAAMALFLPASAPAETASILLAGNGILSAIARLAGLYVRFALGPLSICILIGLVLAAGGRLRGRRLRVDAAVSAACHLWIPVGLLSMIGAALACWGLASPYLPNVPLPVFLAAEPGPGGIALRALLSYGPSAAWLVLLARSALRPAEPAADSAPRAGRGASLALAGFVLAAWASGGAWAAVHFEDLRPLRTGDLAPSFDLPRADLDGRVSADALRGSSALLVFWAEWCKRCVEEMPELERLAAQRPGLAVLAVHQGGRVEALRAFLADKGWAHVRFAVDGRLAASRSYRVDVVPTFFLVDPEGRILARRAGGLPRGWLGLLPPPPRRGAEARYPAPPSPKGAE